ncbi:hypothetical protein C2S53_020587 [Perilla frutescens var. hirtella]|uniref:Cupin type-1 domain-containing protein n=1 Tax=Perilla frutescens var. hirtella TaxID=608512 RepID=A0AAD4NVZ8_PERFH|nr:hypothetical protein C2S53_020587 [Perilla frutescens var. hirtella]
MNYRATICFALAALLLASATTALGAQDPELEQCQRRCRTQHKSDEEQQRVCLRRCDEYRREKHGGRHGGDEEMNSRSPIERLRECNKGCERQQGEQREYCQKRCQQVYDRERERYEEREEHHRGGGHNEGKYEEREREGQNPNPYVFEDRHFSTGIRSQHGRVRILQKFTERSELLRGIENFRVAILESQPQTFVVPNHFDAEIVIFVAKGRGAVSIVREDRRESFNIREGDIFRIRAGATSYLVNRDNNEKLVLVKLIQPVNTPGNFEVFSVAGGENAESYLKAFSNEILEAAFNVKSDKLRRVFGQQREGGIIKASEEQIRGLSHHQEGGIWPFGGESKGTHNLYDKRPTYSNENGQYYEVDSSQFRQLRNLDVEIAIALANISEGAMTAPYYNSRATEINVVVDGEGYFEMACPHLSQSQSRRGREEQYGEHRESRRGGREEHYEQQRESRGQSGYQKIRSRLSVGTVVVVPAGHPFVAVASNNQNLQILSFKVNAYNNEQFTLAGKRNVMNQLEREAKELAFGMPAREVEEVFRSQKEEFFFPGPRRQHEGRSDSDE